MNPFCANFGCGSTSSKPPSAVIFTSGTPMIGAGSSLPSWNTRRRPARSVINRSPFGNQARLQGFASPFASSTTRIFRSAVS